MSCATVVGNSIFGFSFKVIFEILFRRLKSYFFYSREILFVSFRMVLISSPNIVPFSYNFMFISLIVLCSSFDIFRMFKLKKLNLVRKFLDRFNINWFCFGDKMLDENVFYFILNAIFHLVTTVITDVTG